MKHLQILSLRKNTNPHIAELEAEYIKRLKSSFKIQLDDIRQTHATHQSQEVSLLKEAQRVEKKVKSSALLVCLHQSGKSFSSESFASWLSKQKEDSNKDLVFVIGSAYGLHASLLHKSHLVLSLSQMTLTHEHARLILLEQIYRATEILRGSAYHK